eukprot:COSAG01_NODE_19277_length_1019_cov_21.110870_1_plen_67_part_00
MQPIAPSESDSIQLRVRLDRQNDWRKGHDIMGALTYTGRDEQGYYRVGVFGYTRKDVGDHLRWMAG